MKYRVIKQFTFEAAHRLYENYQGKCTNNHGHSWQVALHLEADELDNKGMVIDFTEMKKLKEWIDNELDHTTILSSADPMVDYIKDSKQRLFVVTGNPTSEAIGRVIFEKAVEFFTTEHVKVAKVEIAETCTSMAQIINDKL
jgi:6-pyruvoyltetrahydropterin/6-carboxytetrahydropterin synthase